MGAQDFALKRSIRPYLGELIIIGVITIGLVYTSIRTSTTGLLGVVFVGFVLVLATHYADFRYRVFWRNSEVERIATNKSITTIKASDISRVVLEKSDLATMLTLRRPTRRITIYGKDQQHLDVSLKHFIISDIRRLMQKIHEERPELILPRI
jgi:hypothetical protein